MTAYTKISIKHSCFGNYWREQSPSPASELSALVSNYSLESAAKDTCRRSYFSKIKVVLRPGVLFFMSCSIPGLFLEVLQDLSMRAAPAVYDRIKMQREEATKNSMLLQKKGHHGYAAGEGGKEGRGGEGGGGGREGREGREGGGVKGGTFLL